jgi:hypothetical protein
MIYSELSDPNGILVRMMLFYPQRVSKVDWRRLVGSDIHKYVYSCRLSSHVRISHIAVIMQQWNVLIYLMGMHPSLATMRDECDYYPVEFTNHQTPRLITRMMAVSGCIMRDVPQMEEWAAIPIADRIDDAVRCLVFGEPNSRTVSNRSHIPESPPRASSSTSIQPVLASSSTASTSTVSSQSSSTADEPPIDMQCVICLDAPHDGTMLCGHAQFCYTCLSKVRICPICRAPGKAIKLYRY